MTFPHDLLDNAMDAALEMHRRIELFRNSSLASGDPTQLGKSPTNIGALRCNDRRRIANSASFRVSVKMLMNRASAMSSALNCLISKVNLVRAIFGYNVR
jgi:hypothetical protein